MDEKVSKERGKQMSKIIISSNLNSDFISPELHSQFIEFLGECIYDGIWVGEKSDIPNYSGMRKEVVDALKVLAPPVIRWPGGCYADTYHWRDGIGERASRPVTYNENFGTYETDNNHFGTHEFMVLCEMVGARPWLNVNVLSGGVREMREWVEYCNRSEKTALSMERAKNGSEKPFQVQYWGLGNESWDGGGRMTAQLYAEEYRKYSSAMPLCDARDPESGFKLTKIASGPDGNKPVERVKWTKDFFEELGKYRTPDIDAIDLHFYNWNVEKGEDSDVDFGEKEWYRVIDGCLELESIIKEQYELVNEGTKNFPQKEGFWETPEYKCDLVVGEWGNWHGASFRTRPALYQQCTIRDAITSALTLDIFHRNCDMVKMACVAQTVNVLNSLILTQDEHTILTSNYDVFLMYKVHRGAKKLEITEEEPDHRIYTFASEKEDKIYVNIVNTDMTDEKMVDLQFADSVDAEKVQVLVSDEITACNTVDQPNRIRMAEGKLPEKTEKGYLFYAKPASVNVLTFRKSK